MGEIPERERLIHTDRELRASLDRGLQQAADGQTERRGPFTGPDRVGQLLRLLSFAGFPLAVAMWFAQPPIDVVLLVMILFLGTVVVIGDVARVAAAKRRAIEFTHNRIVYEAVSRDPGHCSTTYEKATGGDHRTVSRALARLVDQGHLTTREEAPLDGLPLVTVYDLKRR